jgi:PAS domain S-box-containing protein
MKNFVFIPVLLTMLTLQCKYIAVADSINQDFFERVIKVKGDFYYPPYEFINEYGEPDGFNVELFKLIANDLGLKYELSLNPWVQVRKELEEGKIDMVMGLMVSEERSGKIIFGLPHSMMTHGLFTHKSSDIRTFDDIRGRMVVVQNGDLMHDFLLKNHYTEQLATVSTQLEAIKLVDEGYYDAAIIGNFQGSHLIRKQKLHNVVLRTSNIKPNPYAMAVSKGNEQLLMLLDKGLLNLKESGEYDRLNNKWFGVYERRDIMDRILPYLLSAVFLIFLLLIFILMLRFRVSKVTSSLSESEEKYRLLIQNMTDLIVKFDKSGSFLYASPSFCRYFGKSEEELLHHKFISYVHEDDQDSFKDEIKKLSDEPHHIVYEQRIQVLNELQWLSWSFSAVLDENNIVKEVIGIGQDITVRKIAEEALVNSENRFRLLLENVSNISVQGYGPDGIVRYWNEASEKLYGFKREETVGKSLLDLIIPEEIESEVSKMIAMMLETGKGIPAEEFKLKHKDGSYVNVLSNHTVIDVPGKGRELFCIDLDLSDLKRAEQIQSVLFNITNAISINNNLKELIDTIQSELSSLMECTNIFIAFYNEKTGMLSIQSESESAKSVPLWSVKNSLTGIVVKEKRSLLINNDEFNKWVQKGKVKLIGLPFAIWLGVPLFDEDNVIGAIVVQSYDNPKAYDQHSVEIMEFVSKQISQVIQRQKALIELLQAKNKAEESDKLKTSFLNNLSHEIRTPLNGIVGFSDLICDSNCDEDERKTYSDIILDNSRALTEIINNIVVMAAIEANQEILNESAVSLQGFFDPLLAEFHEKANKKSLNFRIEENLNSFKDSVLLDKNKLLFILRHLLDNAVKFTKSGGVTFKSNLNDNYLELTVIDTGIGIDRAYQSKIFERFTKVEADTKALYRGNGLGLSIAKAYAELMGGKLWVESSPGKGSIFNFSVRLNKIENENPVSVMKVSNLSKKKICLLIVEDEDSNMQFLKSIARTQSYEIITAEDGQKAVELFKENKNIDLVLMDIQLPILNGFEATKQIKLLRAEVPVIAVTAYALVGDREKAIEAGCDDYLAKPFLKSDLIGLIEKYLSKRI